MSKLKTIFLFSVFILLTQKFSTAEGINNSINFQQNSFVQKFFFITFDDFKKEFIYTKSLDDYLRSIQRVEKKYLRDKIIYNKNNFYNEIEKSKKQKIKKLINVLTLEAWKKIEFETNEFYIILDKLKIFVDALNQSAIIEIALVEEHRKLLRQSVSITNTIDVSYFNHLIDHARYEVFKYTIHNLYK